MRAITCCVPLGELHVSLSNIAPTIGVLTHMGSIFPEPQPRARLVRTGVYAVVRHPLYTSVILLSFAWVLWWRSLPGLVPAGLTVVFLDAKARSEEERLRARFLDYQGYAKRVKRLVPWV